ncbi:MAG: sigma-70 family RNA polymerase sigma factor [Fibrobacteria bacterium]
MNALVAYPPAELTLDHLYRTYRQAIYSICYTYTKSREDAHDLVQETFVKAYHGLAGFEGRSHPKTWLIRIAINQSLSRVIADRRGRNNRQAYLENTSRQRNEYLDDAPTSRLGVEEILKSADKTTRRVLLLAFQTGLTHSEIAETLGVSRVAVTRRITRFKAHVCAQKGLPMAQRKSPKTRPKPAGMEAWVREPAALPDRVDQAGKPNPKMLVLA